MNAVFRALVNSRWIVSAKLRPSVHEFNRSGLATSSNLPSRMLIKPQNAVLFGCVRLPQFVRNWSHQNKSHPQSANFFDGIHQLSHVRLVLRNAGLAAFQRRGHGVAEKRHGRFHERDLFLHAFEPFVLGFIPIKTRARPAHRRVAGPGEIAERDIAIWECRCKPCFDVPIIHLAFKEGVTNEQHPVAVTQLERRIRRGH